MVKRRRRRRWTKARRAKFKETIAARQNGEPAPPIGQEPVFFKWDGHDLTVVATHAVTMTVLD